VGGDTLFCDMYAAYEGLTDEVKARIEGRTAIHDFAHFRKGLRKQGKTEAEIEAFNKAYPMAEHPVVRTHPETGRKALYVNAPFTQYIVGMERSESDALLAHLYAQAAIPEYQCRFRWTMPCRITGLLFAAWSASPSLVIDRGSNAGAPE
jgi:taurine dioxygenase